MSILRRLKTRFAPAPPQKSSNHLLAVLLTQAKRAHYSEDYVAARNLYTEVLHQAQTTGSLLLELDSHLQLADVATLRTEYALALDHINAAEALALKTVGKKLLAHVLCQRGVWEAAQGHTDVAEAHFEQARQMAKTSGAAASQGIATTYLGSLALDEGNASYAIHLLREAIPLLQYSGATDLLTLAYSKLGAALIASGLEPQGITVLNTALQSGIEKQQIALLRQLSLDAGARALQARDYAPAFQAYEHALRLFSYPERQPDVLIQTHLMATYSALKSGNSTDSTRLLAATQALMAISQPHLTRLTLDALRGLLAFQQRHDTDAITHLTRALEQPSAAIPRDLWFDAVQTLGYACRRQRRFDTASAHYTHYLSGTLNSEQSILLRIDYADMLATLPMGRADALRTYQTALAEAQAHQMTPLIAQLYAHIGTIEGELGHGQRAMRHFEQALLLLNSTSDTRIRLIVTELVADGTLQFGDAPDAETLYDLALAESSSDPLALARLRGKRAAGYALSGQVEKAITELTQARHDSLSQQNTLQTAQQTDALAVAYRFFGETTTALAYHQEAITALEADSYPEQMALMQLHLAESLLLTHHEHQQARSHAIHAREIAARSDNALLHWAALLTVLRVAISEKDLPLAQEIVAQARPPIERSGAKRLQADLTTLHNQLTVLESDLN